MRPTVLLTNDDGPPDHRDSPYIFGLYQYLTRELGWDVKVVIPSSQKSWIGKAFHIKEITKGRYFYPKADDGYEGETSDVPRPLKDDEVAEWILLDGTPATCANVALHNLFPGKIDLVISGPNLGRNTSAAFALSSGTIGAAMSSSLSKTRSIALSYGTVVHPTPTTFFQPAHILACRVITHLWSNWGQDTGGLKEGEVDLYSINIPLIEGLLTDEGLKIYWTTMWHNTYGRLFKQISEHADESIGTSKAGPDALTVSSENRTAITPAGSLVFQFSPAMEGLIRPPPSSLPLGSDGWAIHNGFVSVTALRANFGEPPAKAWAHVDENMWKMKL